MIQEATVTPRGTLRSRNSLQKKPGFGDDALRRQQLGAQCLSTESLPSCESGLLAERRDKRTGIQEDTTPHLPYPACVGLRGRYNEREDFLVTTTMPSAESAPSSAELYFPHFVDSGGYTTQFVLCGTPRGFLNTFHRAHLRNNSSTQLELDRTIRLESAGTRRNPRLVAFLIKPWVWRLRY